jgi:transposase
MKHHYFTLKEDSILFFFDEGRFGLRSSIQRMWYEKGKPLTILVQQGYQSQYMFSAVAPKTGDSYSLLLPEINTAMMNLYFQYFSKQFSHNKILLVMDQAGWHKSNLLIIPENITIEYLPPYSPELNPVERLWKWLKVETIHNFIYKSMDELLDAIQKAYQMLDIQKFSKLCSCYYL